MAEPEQFARHLGRAIASMKVGDRLADTILVARRDAAAEAALAAYGQGLLWAVTAQTDDPPGDVDEALARIAPELLGAAGGERALARAREALARTTFDRARMTETDQIADLTAVRAVLGGVIQSLRSRRPSPRRLVATRAIRIGMIAAAVAIMIAEVVALWRPTDLAAGKPWTASSMDWSCDPGLGMCRGMPIGIFFQTREEDSPWVRIDLGSAQWLSSITVINRRDCCAERAIPLLLEIGMDGAHFWKVAEQRAIFQEWKATFPRVLARFVRARVNRRTILHLERISVR